jgi:hypothetical protein
MSLQKKFTKIAAISNFYSYIIITENCAGKAQENARRISLMCEAIKYAEMNINELTFIIGGVMVTSDSVDDNYSDIDWKSIGCGFTPAYIKGTEGGNAGIVPVKAGQPGIRRY